jgi:tetratricopeptide (TPR) repeat protein
MGALGDIGRCALLSALAAAPAWAQDIARYEAGVADLREGRLDAAALTFFELSEGDATHPDVRRQAEYQLAQALERKGLPMAASIYYAGVVQEGKAHPYALQAVEGLVRLQASLRDPFLIPSALNKAFDESWAALPRDVRASINYLIALTSHRMLRLDEAKQFLDEVSPGSPHYAKSQYLLGVVLADPRLPGGAQNDAALEAFQRVLALEDGRGQTDLEPTRQLALLGLGRVLYAQGKYAEAVRAYERVPRFSRFWDQALFELGFARFRNEDYGGALGALQALHAPQFEAAFQPESWLLKATVYYFSCLYDEAAASMRAFHRLYLPMVDRMRPLVEQERELAEYFRMVSDPEDRTLPRPVKLWVRGNERIRGLFGLLERIDQEKRAAAANPAWSGSRIAATLGAYLDQNRETVVQTAGQLVKNRLVEATQNIRRFTNDGSLIRFETTIRQKELYEAGVDQGKILGAQRIHRPAMPGEEWNYWAFQGEFWIDEIGHYQYTLKQGCPTLPEGKQPTGPRPAGDPGG